MIGLAASLFSIVGAASRGDIGVAIAVGGWCMSTLGLVE
jgi:hypothetical protein